MLAFFNGISKIQGPWFLLLLIIMGCEFCALYFQYVMKLAPCVMCIYERVAMLGLFVSVLIASFMPQNELFRWLGLIGWGLSSGWGLKLAVEHVSYQFQDLYGFLGTTCDIFVSFPSWVPLNKWAPWIFEANGNCSKIVWNFLDLSMPQWLVIIFTEILILNVLVILSQFYGKH